MKTLTTSILISILFIFNQNVSFPQQTENWLERNDPIHYRKLYLHTDREFYFQGDSVWFKAYYLDGQTHQFISGVYSMYTDLVDKNGRTIHSQVLPITNGVTVGNIKIPQSLEPGNYLLRAFTDFQKSIGEDAFFYKTLNISKVKSYVELDNSTKKQKRKPEIDVAFLPEGGFLLAGHMNIVGFKAIDENGKGISVRGEILDSQGEVVTLFATKYKGMGKIHFNPQAGEIYKVKIEGYPDYKYEFNDIKKDGIKIEFIGEAKDDLLIQATTNSKLFQGENYYFAIMHRGKVFFYKKFIQKKKDFQIMVNQSVLPAGINRFVLLDEQLKPISERLFFSRNFEVNDFKIRLNQNQYETRSNILLEIFIEEGINDGPYSSLSVAVVDENAVGKNGPVLNILSWLLIDSELKGNIESTADYFKDEENMPSENKLTLLMLTQGWSRYLWNIIPEKNIAPDFKEAEGISIKGNVKRLLSKKPIVDGEIVLNIFKDDYFNIIEGKTDANGRFSFDSIFFTDTATFFIQARNKKGKLSTEIILDPVFEKRPNVSEMYLPAKEIDTELPVKIHRQKYFSDLAMKEFSAELNTIMLEEVIVHGQKLEKDDGHFRIYGKAQTSLKVTDQDIIYLNVFGYLQGRVPGVEVIGDNIVIRGIATHMGNSEPLFLLDGRQVPKENILDLPMFVIDKVEVLKNIGETAIFASRGGNGVISIFTKRGADINIYNTYTKGVIAEKIVGYSSYREFYSPKYTAENIASEKPDHRITLYWNPNIITINGKASLSFFTSDDISNFKVFVEGVTGSGKICLGTTEFTVDKYHANSGK